MNLGGTAALLVIGAACIGGGDAITTGDNLTVHGRLLRLDREQATLQSQVTAGNKESSIPRGQIRVIELNASVLQSAAVTNDAQSITDSDVLVLRGGGERQCGAVAIDDHKVYCSQDEISRDTVARVVLARK